MFRYWLYLDIVYEEVFCETFDLLGPGSTPHECLTVWSDQVHYSPDLWLKTHVQHTVSFIQYLYKGSSIYTQILIWEYRGSSLQHVA